MRRRAETLLTLRALARLAGVPAARIRRYEAAGLVVAERVRDQSGRTIVLYARSQVALVRRIYSYQELGVNLPGIEMLLRLQEQLARRR